MTKVIVITLYLQFSGSQTRSSWQLQEQSVGEEGSPWARDQQVLRKAFQNPTTAEDIEQFGKRELTFNEKGMWQLGMSQILQIMKTVTITYLASTVFFFFFLMFEADYCKNNETSL